MKTYEVNFDGLVGPTHHYGGLSFGNLASTANRSQISNPKAAALQGLEKMKTLHDLGLKQAILPPQPRPDMSVLRSLGFLGEDTEILSRVAKEAPEILDACSSASSMWAANSATVAPSSDTADGKVHFTAANLVAKFHRSLEHPFTSEVFKRIFPDPSLFVHHPALPSSPSFGDEGAANHTRLAEAHGKRGIHLFVYGRRGLDTSEKGPRKFPARQTFEASAAVARRHRLDPTLVVFAEQNPDAIDAGVFHNDVVAVGNEFVFMFHEEAFRDPKKVKEALKTSFARNSRKELLFLEVSSTEIPLEDAVKSYLFNSQLVTLPDGSMALIAPEECKTTPSVARYLEKLISNSSHPIRRAHYFDLKQSMSNGGGPACLRLRVPLTEREIENMAQGILFSTEIYRQIKSWVESFYSAKFDGQSLSDSSVHSKNQKALKELSGLLGLGPL